ncbi:hypothetical protein N7478_009437 [Penicillium angulare]|uniref:uncharacterized protein n=1 Tax=Penicillium angulare TaxID=116970 RepID=UPI002540C28D|nr:uncharacterized protein N7478_009437 [Penicillium angulare]KAJ5266629.1 hypothetical protein N7478_009437 [Penicillium angulare]
MTDDTSTLHFLDNSHKRLCQVRNLCVGYSSKSGPFITGDVDEAEQRNTSRTSIDEDETDLITDKIQADCPECFACLRNVFPHLDGTAVNENGWSYMAIATYSGSLKMIKYLGALDTPNGSCIPLLTLNAHIFGKGTALMMIAQNENRNVDQRKVQLCTFLTPELGDEFEKLGLPLYDVRTPQH